MTETHSCTLGYSIDANTYRTIASFDSLREAMNRLGTYSDKMIPNLIIVEGKRPVTFENVTLQPGQISCRFKTSYHLHKYTGQRLRSIIDRELDPWTMNDQLGSDYVVDRSPTDVSVLSYKTLGYNEIRPENGPKPSTKPRPDAQPKPKVRRVKKTQKPSVIFRTEEEEILLRID